MTTKNTIFKLKEGYILLEDLESWYSDGLVTLEDPIQVYEDGGRRMGCYTIRALIEIYGVEFPFRRVARKLIAAQSSSIPLLASNPGILLDRSKINNLKRLLIYVNPDELKNEERAWPKFLNSVEIPEECLVCNSRISKEPFRLAKHIFGEEHLTKLEIVSKEDYEFWTNIVGKDAVFKSNGPLFSFSDIDGEQCTKEEFDLAMKEMNEAMKNFNGRLIKTTVDWTCEYCSFPFSHQRLNTDAKAFKHILKKSHAKRMNFTAPMEELKFWRNWIDEQISRRNENLSEIQKVKAKEDVFSTAKIPIPFHSVQRLTKTELSGKTAKNPAPKAKAPKIPKPQIAVQNNNAKFQSIPLLLSYSGPSLEKSKIDNLTKLYFETDKSTLENEEGYWAKFLKSVKIPEKCTLCNNEQLSKKPFNLAKHILNEKHLSALRGIPDAEYQCWVQLLSLSTEAKREQDVVQTTESIGSQLVVEDGPVKEGTQPDNVAGESQNGLVENNPKTKKPLEAVDKQAPATKEVPVRSEMENLTETVSTILKKTTEAQIIQEISKPAMDVSKKIEKVEPATTGPCIVTQLATEKSQVPPLVPTGNEPRVPLLDPILVNETSVTKEQFNMVLDECSVLYRTYRGRFDAGWKSLVTWTCSYCSTPSRKVALSNRINTFLHIAKPEHREKMQFQASAGDLNHWMEYLWKIINDEGKQWTGIQKHKAKREVFKRPPNNPRIPLLDVPASQGKLLSQDAFISRYNTIRGQLENKVIDFSKEKLECTCYHCPGKPQINTVNDLMQHVFDGKHCENIMFSATASDFYYYWDLLKKMVPVPQKESPVSIVNPTPKLPEYLIECNLPLFLTQQKMATRTDETCIGPTNSQIVYIGRLVQNPQMGPMTFRDNTICGICQVNISSWMAIKVARHVFSTEHLYALKQTGTNFYISDFEFWIRRLFEDNTLLYPPHFLGSTLPVVCCLGGLKYMDCNVNSEVFKKFSSQELIAINNLDEQKVHSRAESLLRTFGGCVYCMQWLVSGMEVVRHYTSEEHFEMVRKKHPVNMIHVNSIMSYVKQCQKGIEVKPVPIKSAPTPSASTPQTDFSSRHHATTSAMFKDFSFPLFVTKTDMKPRTDEICVGPPNAYVDFVLTTRPHDPGMVWPFMKENTKCKICNIFIPGTSILDAAMHAFSVEHLYNLYKTGTYFYVEDFEWWTNQLYNEPAFVHNPTPLKVIRPLGGFGIPKYNGEAEGSSVFNSLTWGDQKLIARVDEEMVKNISVYLLDTFGACIYCNKWLLTGVEVIKHYTSMEHFGMIRGKHPVLKEFIYTIILMLKGCQKMNRPATQQEPFAILDGFNYLQNYAEYDNPFYLTKEKLGTREKGTVRSGPPNAHIDFLRKAKPKNESLLPKATDKWKKCGICNIPMSHWNILQMVEHAYTVDHMYKRQVTGTPLYCEDFENIMNYLRVQLGIIGHECVSNCTTLTHLGGLRPMSSDNSSVFLEFTEEEKKMLAKLDPKKVESQAMSLLENFGGCIYCNQWFVSGKEVIEHFTSESHFTNIRKKEPVKRSYVNCMMEYVRRCQKDPCVSCSVM